MSDEYGIGHLVGASDIDRETEAAIRSGLTQAQREAEIERLIARANDPDDPYDGHHGQDRSEDSVAYAKRNNPEVAAHIERNIRLGDKGQ